MPGLNLYPADSYKESFGLKKAFTSGRRLFCITNISKCTLHLLPIFVQPIPRDSGFPLYNERQVSRLIDPAFCSASSPFPAQYSVPVAVRVGSRNTVTRSCGICTRFPFHLRSQSPQAPSVYSVISNNNTNSHLLRTH